MIVDERRLENLKDSNINCNGLFYLTCSQAFQTMSKVDESLAGRVGVLDLYGFSSREIAKQEENFIPDINILENKKMLEKKILLNYIKNNNRQLSRTL